MLRRLLVIVIAAILAAQVIRSAAVRAFAEAAPATAARVWPGHPAVVQSLGMIAIAEATRERRPVSAAVFERIYASSRGAPLSPEPFLVRGVQAQMAGDVRLAEQAFLAAERRDPRSLPARYFLADLYLRQGQAARGLREIASLGRLAPNGVTSLAPHVATFAQNRGNWPQLRAVFRSEPMLEESTLSVLATDAANADLVLALADPRRRGPSSPWLQPLLASLSNAGQHAKARQIWAQISGVQLGPGALLYDPRFADGRAPPPFNWSLTSSTLGLAERQPGGGLHVIYYGQEDGPLASQVLILRPGSYRFVAQVVGGASGVARLEWRLVCATNNSAIAWSPLHAAVRGWAFEVPSACAAQRLELFGSSSDTPQQADLVIRSVSLTRERPHG